MRKLSLTKKVAIGACVAAASVVGLGAPARAADGPFIICVDACNGEAEYSITWLNRTANVGGTAYDFNAGTTTVLFEAFAGTTKIDTQTRYVDDAGSTGYARPIGFTIGDPNLVGGINRIRVTICRNYTLASQICSAPQQRSR